MFRKRILPLAWKSSAEAEGVIDTWRLDNDSAIATLDGGKRPEIPGTSRRRESRQVDADPVGL